MSDQVGAIIEGGPTDWTIVQQDAAGIGHFAVQGRWVGQAPGRVEVRLVHEALGAAVSRELDWRPAETSSDGTWRTVLESVPAGGLYRLETRYRPSSQTAGEWSPRGDMRHFLGVGDLWVIAGQSNSAGYGREPVGDPPELGVHLFRNSGQWALATHPMNESTDTVHPVNREQANPGHAPYLQFGRTMQRALGHPIGLVQTSLGGSPLSAWNPTETGGAGLFANMVRCVTHVGGRVRGVLWYQGESDAGGTNAESYAERFAAAVAAWRQALNQAELPVLTVQLNRYTGEGDARGWSLVREAQRQVAHRVPGVAVVPAFDLPLSDAIHTSSHGNLLLGARLAQAALGFVHGRPVDWRAPEVTVARRNPAGSEIELHFAPVTSRMDSLAPAAACFVVEDADGSVPIDKIGFPGDARVVLTLARSMGGNAVVHGGYGANPATVPMDMERVLPMLGFHGLPVCEPTRCAP